MCMCVQYKMYTQIYVIEEAELGWIKQRRVYY